MVRDTGARDYDGFSRAPADSAGTRRPHTYHQYASGSPCTGRDDGCRRERPAVFTVTGVTRRALLAGGSAALLAGCGARKDRGVDPADLLALQLQAAQASVAAYTGLRGAPRDQILARARARVRRIEAALRAAGGQPRPEPDAARSSSVPLALSAASAELRAHVAATGRTADRALRSLLAELVAGTAEEEALLMRALGRDPLATAFPGQAL